MSTVTKPIITDETGQAIVTALNAIAAASASSVQSGETTFASANSNNFTINHALNTKKLLLIMQRVNSDHSDVVGSSRYKTLCLICATQEALWDTQQKYRYTSDTTAYGEDISTAKGYLFGAFTYYAPNASSDCLAHNYLQNESNIYGLYASSDSQCYVTARYEFEAGRYIWTLYSLEE